MQLGQLYKELQSLGLIDKALFHPKTFPDNVRGPFTTRAEFENYVHNIRPIIVKNPQDEEVARVSKLKLNAVNLVISGNIGSLRRMQKFVNSQK